MSAHQHITGSMSTCEAAGQAPEGTHKCASLAAELHPLNAVERPSVKMMSGTDHKHFYTTDDHDVGAHARASTCSTTPVPWIGCVRGGGHTKAHLLHATSR